MKKILSVLLILMLLTAVCTACAEELTKEEYYVMDDLGYELWITPEVQPVELTEEDRENYFIAYFADEAYDHIVSITYFPEFNVTLEEYAELLQALEDTSDVKITAIGDIPCVTYLIHMTDTTAIAVSVVDDVNVLELVFAPYDDPAFTEVIDRMIQSIRKTE